MDRRRTGSQPNPAGPATPPDASREPDPGQPTVYEIRVAGHLDDRSAGWHEGLTVTREENGNALLTARVVDQAALHGLLRKLRDLGVRLLSINPAGQGLPGTASKEKSR